MSEWIEFKSGVQPVPDGVQVKIKTVDGDIEIANAECFTWEIGGYNSDIVAYKVEGQPQVNYTFSDLSVREYAAIKLRVPDSGTDWLDAMIEKSLLNEFAGKALQGFIAYMGCDPDANDQLGGTNRDMLSASSYKYAQAMLKASKGE